MQARYHISKLTKPRHHKYSAGGLTLNTKHHHVGHATVKGTSFDHVHKHLKTQKPPHALHKHAHHLVASHKHTHVVKRSSAGIHQRRAATTERTLHESKSDIAAKRIATMRSRGEKIGFARLTSAQRSDYAKRAAATRRAKGENNFGHMSAAARSAAAHKAALTRRSRGEKPFSHESSATRHQAALRAAQTRKNRGESAFRHMTASARSAAAKRAAVTRAAKHER